MTSTGPPSHARTSTARCHARWRRRGPWSLAAVAATLALLAGMAITTAAAATATPKPPAIAVLVWSPATSTGAYDFGTILAAFPVTKQFTLTNTGSAPSGPVTISLTGPSTIPIPGPTPQTPWPAQLEVTANTCQNVQLGKKKTCTVTIRFGPFNYGENDSGSLGATAPNAAAANLALSGSSVQCTATAVLTPGTGEYAAPGPITLSAVGSNPTCGNVPVVYFWTCDSLVDQLDCDNLEQLTSGGHWETAPLSIEVGAVYDVSVATCLTWPPDDTNCSTPASVSYTGIEPF